MTLVTLNYIQSKHKLPSLIFNMNQSFQKLLLFSILFILQFNVSFAQEIRNEYLLKLPDSYFIENISITINDKVYNEQYFETKAPIKLNKIFIEEKSELHNWILVETELELDSKFAAIQNKGKLLHFQKNNRFKIQSIPNDSLYHKQWYHRKIQAVEGWRNFAPAEKIILTVIDTGIDYNHPDLANSLWINSTEDLNGNGILDSLDINEIDDDGNGYIDDVIGWDFTDAPRFPDGGDYLNPDNDPMDEFQSGHGTQIAGIVAAQADNNMGIAGLTPDIDVMNLRAGTASGYLEEDDVAAAIVYAIENGSRVINMSFGDVVVSAFLKDVVRYAHSQNVVLVTSSGNSGTNELHFPSGFAETISVGATDSLDALAGFSSWGQTLDLVGPGKDIISTKIGGGFNYVNGTSFSAPMVSAAAAFVLSNYPDFSNEQVRNILKSSSDDKGASGWDEYFGSGRLNLFKTSLVQNESELIIESPASGSYTALDAIPIIATIQDADLQNASLLIGEGENPSSWIEVISGIQNQVISDTIASINLSNYANTTLILRLLAETWQGQIKEYRSVLNIDKTIPVISNLEKIAVFDKNRRAMLISFQTDDVTRGEIRLRPLSSTAQYNVKNLKYETKNHKILIGSDDISGDVEFEIYVENLASLEITESGTALYEFNLSLDIIPDFNFTKLNYSLPKGFLLPKTTDFDGDGNKEIVLSLYDENNSFGNVAVYEFENNQFNKRAETSFPVIPRDYGDSDGDGKMELLLGFGRTSYLLEASNANGFPDNEVWKDTSDFWVSRICDLDNDGSNEILGKSGTEYKLLETTGDNSYTERFIFSNPTTGNNALGPPSAIVSDFDNDANPDLAFGDYDGDFVIYENSGNDVFTNRYSENLPLTDATDFLSAGNFLDSSKQSFLIGTHTDESANLESEFDARIWSYFHFVSESDNNYSKKQRINIFGYADVRELDSGISTGKGNNQTADYVMISAFPDLYIFQSNGDSLVPKWYYNGIQSNKIILNDFDKNGASEIYFNNGDSIVAYEIGESNRPLPPSNVQAIPLDTSTVQVTWDAEAGIQRYFIWRGLRESSLVRLDSVGVGTEYEDGAVAKDSTYFYALQIYDNSFAIPYSPLSSIQSAKPNMPPRLDTLIVINNNQVQLFFNEVMLKNNLQANNFRIIPQQKYATSAIPVKNSKGVLLSFSTQFKSDSINTVFLSDIRDSDKTLLDSVDQVVRFFVEEIESAPYIKQWELEDRFKLIVNYNLPMDIQTILNLDNYELEPSGEIIDVQSLDNYNMSFELTLSPDSYAGATGIPTYINFNNICSSNGELFEKGDRFSLTKSAESLKNLIVYPQPVKKNSDVVTFANITPKTEIKIFDINGKLVVDLKEDNNDGGISWDMSNNKGNRVAAGIYIFYATNEKETKTGKIAIVR
jgi:subtilase family protein/type IX secretion system substrate protein/VCBS repeat protein